MAGIYINIEDAEGYLSKHQTQIHVLERYTRALCREIIHYAASHGQNETIESLYVAGPIHLLPFDSLQRLFQAVFSEFDTSNIQEVTVDLEPGAVSEAYLSQLESIAVTRINLLVRSFFDDDLRRLECTYFAIDIQEAIEFIQKSNIPGLSVELYYDIEDQPFEYWGANLEKTSHRHIPHLSLRTSRESKLMSLPRQLTCCFFFPELGERAQERFSFAMNYLEEAGYQQYVLMEFAREERRSHHAMQHVHQSNMLGIGPNAHSFWWRGGSHSQAHRWSNADNIERYIALLKQRELPVDSKSLFDLDNLANEYILLNIQTIEGINTEQLESDYGVDLYSEKIEQLALLESEGWIEPVRNNRVRLTTEGRIHCYHVIPKLLLDV